jgi:hypothetical protein
VVPTTATAADTPRSAGEGQAVDPKATGDDLRAGPTRSSYQLGGCREDLRNRFRRKP